MKKTLTMLCLLLSISGFSQAQDCLKKGIAAMDESEAKIQLEFLASDLLQGRRGDTPYGRIAAQYIASELEELGYEPQISRFTRTLRLRSGESKEFFFQNVVLTIPGEDTTKSVFVGAHYDHIGLDREGNVCNGADDNASGVVAMLQIARAIKESGEKPAVNISFGFWDGEEMGLLGSFAYVQFLGDKTEGIRDYINLDMIGRNKEGQDPSSAGFMYVKAKKRYVELVDEIIDEFSFENVTPNYLPMKKLAGNSDHAPFAQKGIPVIFWHTGVHPDYHKATDTAEKLNWPKIMDIARVNYVLLWRLAQDAALIK